MESEQRHALLIGVRISPRIYEHPCLRIRGGDDPLSRDSDYGQLNSDQEVDEMRQLLVNRFDFPEENTRVLKTEEATQEAILTAVEELVGRVGRDDVVVLYYAGHGSRMRDPLNPEGMRETIVPYDSGRAEGREWECALAAKRPCTDAWRRSVPDRTARRCGRRPGWEEQWGVENRDIPDLEIDRWVEELNNKTPYVTLIFDCCHSGSVTRVPFGRVLETVVDLRPASEMFEGAQVPPLFAGSRSLEEERMRSGWLPAEGRRVVMIASCRSHELGWERPYDARSLLTYHLQSALYELGPEATWRDVLEKVTPQVSAERLDQHPQLEGEIDLQVFSRKKARARPYLSVVAVDSEGVDLWGGAAHGVSLGSVWTIRPHGTRSRHEGDQLGKVRIERVRPVTSRGRVEDVTRNPLEAGQRAFLLEQDLQAPGLRVAIAAPEARRGKLVEMLGKSQLLAVVEEAEDVIAHCLAPRDPVGSGDPCPFLGPLTEWTWAVVDAAGQLRARLRPDDDDGIEGLTEDLVRVARFEGLRQLANPDPESRLNGRVELRILQCPAPEEAPFDGPDSVTEEDEASGMLVVEEGGKVDFEIENKHDEEVWVSLVEFDCDHSIAVLMPARAHPHFRPGGQRLAPGQLLRMGSDYYRVKDGLPAVLPEGFPWSAAEDGRQEVGVSTFKLLVTSVPADFEFLEQEETRFEGIHPLQKLAWLYHSSFGSRTVILPPEDVSGEQDWTVVTKGLGIRRRQET